MIFTLQAICEAHHAKAKLSKPTVHPSCHWDGPPRYLRGGRAGGSCQEGRRNAEGKRASAEKRRIQQQAACRSPVLDHQTSHTPLRHPHAPLLSHPRPPSCSRAPRRAPLSLRQVQERERNHDFIVNGRSTGVARHTAACVSDVTCVRPLPHPFGPQNWPHRDPARPRSRTATTATDLISSTPTPSPATRPAWSARTYP